MTNLFQEEGLWSEKNNEVIVDKMINLNTGQHALILAASPFKQIRFLYLCALMSKKNSHNMSIILSKMSHMIKHEKEHKEK